MINCCGQTYNPEAVNKKASETYTKALNMLQMGERTEVIPVLQKAIDYDKNFVDAYLSLGGVFGELKDYANSVANYENAINLDSIYTKYYLVFSSQNLAGLGRFNDALNAVNKFLTIEKLSDKSRNNALHLKSNYEFAIEYAATHTDANYEFAPVNLGE